MRLLRFRRRSDTVKYAGRLIDDEIHVLEGDIFEPDRLTGETVRLDQVQLLAPVEPSKVVAIGWNFVGHADELGYLQPTDPLMFLKATSAIVGPNDDIVRPEFVSTLSYEGELALVIGDDCVDVPPARALDHIFGWTVGNDVTDRETQKREVQYARSKSFNTFCPLGPWVDTEFDHSTFHIETRVNGELMQSGGIELMIHRVPELVAWVSRAITLNRGDVIMTGTPQGVGIIEPGDEVEVSIAGIGSLCNAVVEEEVDDGKEGHEAADI